MQLEEQGVGVGEPAEAVHRQALALIGLTGDPAGVAGDERDEEHLHRPLDGGAGVVVEKAGSRAHGMLTARIDTHGDADAEAEPAGEAGDGDGGEQRRRRGASPSSPWR